MQGGDLAMWWWIGGGVVVALVVFVCWIVWELYHAPFLPDLLDGCFSEEDEEQEQENSI